MTTGTEFIDVTTAFTVKMTQDEHDVLSAELKAFLLKHLGIDIPRNATDIRMTLDVDPERLPSEVKVEWVHEVPRKPVLPGTSCPPSR